MAGMVSKIRANSVRRSSPTLVHVAKITSTTAIATPTRAPTASTPRVVRVAEARYPPPTQPSTRAPATAGGPGNSVGSMSVT